LKEKGRLPRQESVSRTRRARRRKEKLQARGSALRRGKPKNVDAAGGGQHRQRPVLVVRKAGTVNRSAPLKPVRSEPNAWIPEGVIIISDPRER